jgi:hypothetical protein
MTTIEIDHFLRHVVEQYLFKDLDKMRSLVPDRGLYAGGAGYPMLMATISGMELLGTLLDEGTSDPGTNSRQYQFNPEMRCVLQKNGTYKPTGENYFRNFWHLFTEEFPAYSPYHDLIRGLVRNPLAHAYVTVPRVIVVKDRLTAPPAIGVVTESQSSEAKDYAVIDAGMFFDDFRRVYERRIKTLLPADTGSSSQDANRLSGMQAMLDSMIDYYSRKWKNISGQAPKGFRSDRQDVITVLREVDELPSFADPMAFDTWLRLRVGTASPSVAIPPVESARIIHISSKSFP